MLTPKFTNGILKFIADNNLTWKYIQLQTGWEKTKLSRILTGVDDYTPEEARLIADKLGHDIRYFVQYLRGKFGRWRFHDSSLDGAYYYCSNCQGRDGAYSGYSISPEKFNYCPFCGTRMNMYCTWDEMVEMWWLESTKDIEFDDEVTLHKIFEYQYESTPEVFNARYNLDFNDPHYINPDLVEFEEDEEDNIPEMNVINLVDAARDHIYSTISNKEE